MSEFEHAREHLIVWIRDYGDQKQSAFIADMQIVLDEAERLRVRLVEVTQCTMGVGDGSGQLFVHGSHDAIREVRGWLDLLEERRQRIADLEA